MATQVLRDRRGSAPSDPRVLRYEGRSTPVTDWGTFWLWMGRHLEYWGHPGPLVPPGLERGRRLTVSERRSRWPGW